MPPVCPAGLDNRCPRQNLFFVGFSPVAGQTHLISEKMQGEKVRQNGTCTIEKSV
jgi:hypothetical protein